MEKKDMACYIDKTMEPTQFLEKIYCSFVDIIRRKDSSKDIVSIDSVVSMDPQTMTFSVIVSKENINTLADVMEGIFSEHKYDVTRRKDDETSQTINMAALGVNASKKWSIYGASVDLKDTNPLPESYTYKIRVHKLPLGP